MIVTRTTEAMPAPTPEAREAVHRGPVTMAAFEHAFAAFEALHVLEVASAPELRPLGRNEARIVFWNAERLKFLEPSAALLGSAQADAVLLCETDLGMARSDNRHTVRDLAEALGAGYAFGTEFVELDLGDARERSWHAGLRNEAGLHGGAILSRHPLERPALARLETSGRWFDGAFGERRVGGRMAMMADLALADGAVLLVAVHYESHTGPEDRLLQTKALLDAVDEHAPSRPVLIGGDFNTNTFERYQKKTPGAVSAALALDPDRLVHPVPYEPMFRHLADRGYDWAACNLAHRPTQRTRPDGTPAPPFGKIDWFFARGLVCRDPAILPAVDAQGVAISDHEALAVTIALA